MKTFTYFGRLIVVLLSFAILTGCAAPSLSELGPGAIYDPHEQRNRKVHAFNKSIDTAVLRSVGTGYAKVVPPEIQQSIGHFATNFGRPSDAVNAILQGDVNGFGIATSRFLINTVLGIGGLFDAASEFGIPEHDTDFGETLHVWGAKEGAYLEAPFRGPSTQRDTAGFIVDLVTNPLSYVLPSPEGSIGTVATVADRIGARGRLAETIDSVLYDSADSYAQTRLIYLQNRRFELGQAQPENEIDPFDLDTEGF